jgi:Beta-propeller repeat
VLNATASAFVYSTYLGGSASNYGSGISVDGTGEAYVAGVTTSTDFPLQNPIYPSCNPCNSAFLSKFNSGGSALVYSTYLIGSSGPSPTAVITVDQSGNAFVAASGVFAESVPYWDVSSSGTLNFTNSLGDVDGPTIGVGVDAAGNLYLGAGSFNYSYGNIRPNFLASFTNSGTQIYSIQLPALAINGVAGADAGNVYLTGSPDNNTPFYSVNMFAAYQPASGFLSRVSAQDAPALGYSPPSLAFGYEPVGGTTQPQTLTLDDLGSATLDLSSIVVSGPGFSQSQPTTCTTTLAPWTTCTYSVIFTPLNSNPAVGAITITDNSLGSPHVIQLTGEGAVPQVSLNPTSLSFPEYGCRTEQPAAKCDTGRRRA